MYDPKRIAFAKWTAIVLGVVLLSQSIARWRVFFDGPSTAAYVVLIATLTLFLMIFLGLGVVVYAEEKNKGSILVPKPWFEGMADRFFMTRHDSSRG
jgi:hypothetical protein